MLQWALGHHVAVEESDPDAKTGCLFVFTDIEYYNNDKALFENFGFDIIGKIRGVVSWEVLGIDHEKSVPPSDKNNDEERERLEIELMQKLCALPITISIMPRMEGKFAWKCLEASGYAESFTEALEASLTHLTRVFKLIRSELFG